MTSTYRTSASWPQYLRAALTDQPPGSPAQWQQTGTSVDYVLVRDRGSGGSRGSGVIRGVTVSHPAITTPEGAEGAMTITTERYPVDPYGDWATTPASAQAFAAWAVLRSLPAARQWLVRRCGLAYAKPEQAVHIVVDAGEHAASDEKKAAADVIEEIVASARVATAKQAKRMLDRERQRGAILHECWADPRSSCMVAELLQLAYRIERADGGAVVLVLTDRPWAETALRVLGYEQQWPAGWLYAV